MARRILPKFSFALNISGHKYICTSHIAPTCSRDTHINVHTEVTIVVHCCPMLPIVAHCCPLLSIVSQCVWGEKLSAMSNCPQCQIVRGVKLSGVKLSTVSNCPGVKLPAVSNYLQCQIVRGVIVLCQTVLMSNCPHVKLSANMGGVKLSAVSNCPRTVLWTCWRYFMWFKLQLHQSNQSDQGTV